MRKSVFILSLIVFAFAACKKNKAENPPIERQQQSFSLDRGTWRVFINNNWGPDAFIFNTLDSSYVSRKFISGRTVVEEGPFHTRAFNNPDSLEFYLLHDTLIVVKLDKVQLKITQGDSTRLFRKQNNPG